MARDNHRDRLGVFFRAAHRWRTVSALILVAALVVPGVVTVRAVHLPFELDGNTADGGASGIDWETLFNTTGSGVTATTTTVSPLPPNFVSATFVKDYETSAAGALTN